jgi:uncharacterized protein
VSLDDLQIEGITSRDDGVYLDARLAGSALVSAIDRLFASGRLLAGLDYPALCRTLYGVGPELAPQPGMLVRVASRVMHFDAARKALYRPVKLSDGVAEYYFEPQFLEAEELSDGTLLPERPVTLDFDEFVADLWSKGIRFGVQEASVRAAMAAPRGERTTAARRLEPSPAADAQIVEVSRDLHRSNAPRERADGRVDLTSFQNRFPQMKHGQRLLQKLPGTPGEQGRELSGAPIPPLQPGDVNFASYAGPGTLIVREPDGEFLIANQDGFLDVDTRSGQLSVNDKIVSREGVSGRTTGNLELMGAFEEFGDVQELRDVNGSDITVHGDVFGNIKSSGGVVVLGRNLVGGSVLNAKGSIRIAGVASGSTIQCREGEVRIDGRAESCVITGSKIVIEEASNCEIFGDEVEVKLAIGCAVSGRKVVIESAGPRRNSEMVVYVQVKDVSGHEKELAALGEQGVALEAELAKLKAEHEALSTQSEVRAYLALADRLRKGELQLTAAQVPQLKRLAGLVAPQVKLVGQLLQAMKAAEVRQEQAAKRIAELEALKRDAAARSSCAVKMVDGDTLVRTIPLSDAAAAAYDLPAKDYKTLLRGPRLDSETLFAEGSGKVNWHGGASVA